MKKVSTTLARHERLAELERLGFDRSIYFDRLACSGCEACNINGVPCHETGCLNAMHECAGCNEIIPMRQKYCEGCSN